MKELVIVSGKGGTGKTSISSALSFFAPEKIMVDCDVDAANFHLISGAVTREKHGFKAGFEPVLNKNACIHCGKCTALCRFGAITNGIITSPLNCEGCGVCAFQCPAHAISMKERNAGQWFVSDTRFGCLIHAELGLSVENSGKLVSQIRQEAKRLARDQHLPLIITDGPPGIGCPAIAALSGAHLILAIAEPSVSSIHDVKRLADLVSRFAIPLVVCINKSTLHPDNTKELTLWCRRNAIPIVGQLPYSDIFRQAVQAGKTVMEMPEYGEVKAALTGLWHNLAKQLDIDPSENKPNFLKQKINFFC